MGLFPEGYDTCGWEPSQTPGGRRTSKADPPLTGQSTPNGNTRALLALPVRLGSMGIVNPTTLPTVQHQSSVRSTLQAAK